MPILLFSSQLLLFMPRSEFFRPVYATFFLKWFVPVHTAKQKKKVYAKIQQPTFLCMIVMITECISLVSMLCAIRILPKSGFKQLATFFFRNITASLPLSNFYVEQNDSHNYRMISRMIFFYLCWMSSLTLHKASKQQPVGVSFSERRPWRPQFLSIDMNQTFSHVKFVHDLFFPFTKTCMSKESGTFSWWVCPFFQMAWVWINSVTSNDSDSRFPQRGACGLTFKRQSSNAQKSETLMVRALEKERKSFLVRHFDDYRVPKPLNLSYVIEFFVPTTDLSQVTYSTTYFDRIATVFFVEWTSL